MSTSSYDITPPGDTAAAADGVSTAPPAAAAAAAAAAVTELLKASGDRADQLLLPSAAMPPPPPPAAAAPELDTLLAALPLLTGWLSVWLGTTCCCCCCWSLSWSASAVSQGGFMLGAKPFRRCVRAAVSARLCQKAQQYSGRPVRQQQHHVHECHRVT